MEPLVFLEAGVLPPRHRPVPLGGGRPPISDGALPFQPPGSPGDAGAVTPL